MTLQLELQLPGQGMAHRPLALSENAVDQILARIVADPCVSWSAWELAQETREARRTAHRCGDRRVGAQR